MNQKAPSSVYGPVQSWRLGKSLGIDLLCIDSICSFECVYCQLGKINRVTFERDVFIPTDRLIIDLMASEWNKSDVITFSGSGEPTLAKNLGKAIARVKAVTGKPVAVLTNSTLLGSVEVRREIALADKIFCKLDAWSEDVLRRVDRPHREITLRSIVDGIVALRGEFKGFLAIQTMLLRRPNENDLRDFAKILNKIKPDEIQLNLPTRAIPDSYFVETRGNEVADDPRFTHLKTISKKELEGVRLRLTELTEFPVLSR